MRPLALERRNRTFAGFEAGGKRFAMRYRRLITAKLNGYDPLAHFSDVLHGLPATLLHDSDQLLPCTNRDAAAARAASSSVDPHRIVSAN